MADDKTKAEPTQSDETKGGESKETPEFVQIPKSEYEGWKKEIEDTRKFREEAEDYLKQSSVVVTTLASDPALRTAFRKKLVGDGQISGEQQEQKDETKNTPSGESGKGQVPVEVTELSKSQRL